MKFLAEDLTNEVTEEISEQTSLVRDWFNSIDWNEVGVKIISISIQIIIALILFFIIRKIGVIIIDAFFKRYKNRQDEISPRYTTIHRLTVNVFNALAIFTIVYIILTLMNIPVGTLLAGAGVLGLAISLGAQGFVSDLVNGMSILIENQMDIGDDIQIEDIEGTVINLTLRMVTIKAYDGAIYYIPNREIEIISNRSKNEMRVLIQIRLFPETNLPKVREIMNQVSEKLTEELDAITTPPGNIMFISDDNNQLIARVQLFTEPGSQFGTKGIFYEAYIQALVQAGIDLPYGEIDAPE